MENRNYRFSIIGVVVLAFGAAIAVVFSLYLTEKMLVENRIKVWKIATTSLISGVLFVFFISFLLFYLQTSGPSEGLEAIASLFWDYTFTFF